MIYKKHRKTTMSLHKTTIFLNCKKQRKGRKREAQRQRETERQRERETGRQRETERQTRQRDRKTISFV
jgi:hypothetical protein